ncbi:MAG: metallophosphoesterase [Thauera sp.]|nr:metallophosphoesterase [Thauera sp.]
MAYDIIGDLHGQAEKLERLLRALGYQLRDGSWRHPERKAIFVGDFIDRGPAQLRTVGIVRRMVESDAAFAVMGNHELNAVAWHTPHPNGSGDYLRSHFHPQWGDKNRHQHQRFLTEVEHQPDVHRELIEWFLTLPLWLDLPGIRVVHACWHQPYMDWLNPFLTDNKQLPRALLEAATCEPDDPATKDDATPSVFKAVEALLKGIEIPLPEPHHFTDKDGIVRKRVRVRWWDGQAQRYPQAAMLSPDLREQLPDLPIPAHAVLPHAAGKPIFFGHYWLTGEPEVLGPPCACVDYSAGKGGALVAYRWNGESTLAAANFVAIS